jgi:uncharacterized membrane protein
VPNSLSRLVSAAGMMRLVRWEATHDVNPPQQLRWQSLSGLKNSGEATFETCGRGVTKISLRLSYTLPDLAGPIFETSLVQNFVRRTMLSTMERFRDSLEEEALEAGFATDEDAQKPELEPELKPELGPEPQPLH